MSETRPRSAPLTPTRQPALFSPSRIGLARPSDVVPWVRRRISDLRAAIERQQTAAEKQQEELEAAAMANLTIPEQLSASFCSRVHAIIKHLQVCTLYLR